MSKIRKTGGTSSGLKTIDCFGKNQRTFSSIECNFSGLISQCKRCKSDYMRDSVDGYCQRCLQRVEFITREQSDAVATAPGSGGGR